MKKIVFAFTAVFCLAFMLNSSLLQAASDSAVPPFPSGYYVVSPKLNPDLQIDANLKLGKLTPGFQKLEFFYVPSKQAYVINDQFGFRSVKYTGSIGVSDLIWADQNIEDPSMLWTLEKVSDNQFFIHNKQYPNMVWDVHNYYAKLGVPIKAERKHAPGSARLDAQTFTLSKPKRR